MLLKSPFDLRKFSKFDFFLFISFMILLQLTVTTPTDYFQKTIPNIEISKIYEEEGVLLIDARHPKFFNEEHIPDAINIPYGLYINNPEKLSSKINEMLKEESRILVVYCESEICSLANNIARRINKILPDKRIYILDGGIESYMKYINRKL